MRRKPEDPEWPEWPEWRPPISDELPKMASHRDIPHYHTNPIKCSAFSAFAHFYRIDSFISGQKPENRRFIGRDRSATAMRNGNGTKGAPHKSAAGSSRMHSHAIFMDFLLFLRRATLPHRTVSHAHRDRIVLARDAHFGQTRQSHNSTNFHSKNKVYRICCVCAPKRQQIRWLIQECQDLLYIAEFFFW